MFRLDSRRALRTALASGSFPLLANGTRASTNPRRLSLTHPLSADPSDSRFSRRKSRSAPMSCTAHSRSHANRTLGAGGADTDRRSGEAGRSMSDGSCSEMIGSESTASKSSVFAASATSSSTAPAAASRSRASNDTSREEGERRRTRPGLTRATPCRDSTRASIFRAVLRRARSSRRGSGNRRPRPRPRPAGGERRGWGRRPHPPRGRRRGGGARAVVRARRRAGVDVIGIVADRESSSSSSASASARCWPSPVAVRASSRASSAEPLDASRARDRPGARARGVSRGDATRKIRPERAASRVDPRKGRPARTPRGRPTRARVRARTAIVATTFVEGAARAKDASRRRRGERLVDALRVDRSRATRRRGRLCRAHRHDAIDATGTPRESSVPPPLRAAPSDGSTRSNFHRGPRRAETPAWSA